MNRPYRDCKRKRRIVTVKMLDFSSFNLCLFNGRDYNQLVDASEETILLIERAGRQIPTFATALSRKGFEVEVFSTGRLALAHACQSRPVLVVLNAASLGSNGMRICRSLHESLDGVPIIHIFPDGASALDSKDSPAEITLVMPFTARKLINRIKRLLPGARKDAVQVGPIRLASKVRIVEAHGREKRLTPKTAHLLNVFLQNPGKTLDRAYLMRRVWNTDYVGDTRTLDVHMRWVREAVEVDPKSPRYIVTVRGVGYRFEPDPPVEEED